MILVILMVILNVFTKRVHRSKAASKLSSQLKKQAEVKSFCGDSKTDNFPEGMWLYLLTDSVSGGASGFKVKNYYKGESFTCKFMNQISSEDSRNRYFASFRDFSSWDATSTENGWTKMRHFQMWMKGEYRYQFLVDKNLFSDDINESELISLIKQLNQNKDSYLSRFRTSKTKLSNKKIEADSKTEQKAKNIVDRAQLQQEVKEKNKKLIISQNAKIKFTTQSDASKLQIKTFESQIATIRTTKFSPLIESLRVQSLQLDSIEQEIAGNDKKLQGIVPIDQNDLSASKTKLLKKLNDLNALYLDADPKHTAIKDLIDNFDTKQDLIPNVIA